MCCIDLKFLLDVYRRLPDLGDEARRDFSLAVRKHADSIAEKYILPDEHTFDYALMFVPSEGVFYELIMTQDTKYGALDEYCRSKRVYPVSPNTVCAIVGSIAMREFTGAEVSSRKTRWHLLANLSGLAEAAGFVRGSVWEIGHSSAKCTAELRRRRQQTQPRAE